VVQRRVQQGTETDFFFFFFFYKGKRSAFNYDLEKPLKANILFTHTHTKNI
jgi:hypothetical protein